MKIYVKTTGSGFLPEEEKGFELMRFARVSEFDNKHLEALEEMGYTIVYSSSAGNAGLRLRKYREAAGKSAAEMAEELGVSELRYKRMESGVSLITPKALALIPAGKVYAPSPAKNPEPVWERELVPVDMNPVVKRPTPTAESYEKFLQGWDGTLAGLREGCAAGMISNSQFDDLEDKIKAAEKSAAEFQEWLDAWIAKGMTWDDTERKRDVLEGYQTGKLEFDQKVRDILDKTLERKFSSKKVEEMVKPVATRKMLTSDEPGFSEEVQRARDYWQTFMKPYLDAGLGYADTGEGSIVTDGYSRGWRMDKSLGKVVFWLSPGEEKRFRGNLEKALAGKKKLPTAGKFAKWWDNWVIEGMELEDIDEDIEVVRKYQRGELEFTKEVEDRFDDSLTDELVRRAR